MLAQRYEIYVLVATTLSHSIAALIRDTSRHRVISCMYPLRYVDVSSVCLGSGLRFLICQ